jgi:hypothetical protein
MAAPKQKDKRANTAKKPKKTEEDPEEKELKKGLLEILKNKDISDDNEFIPSTKKTNKKSQNNSTPQKPQVNTNKPKANGTTNNKETKKQLEANNTDHNEDDGFIPLNNNNKHDNEISPENVKQFESIREKVDLRKNNLPDNEKKKPEYKFYQMFFQWTEGEYTNTTTDVRVGAATLEQKRSHAEQCYTNMLAAFEKCNCRIPDCADVRRAEASTLLRHQMVGKGFQCRYYC